MQIVIDIDENLYNAVKDPSIDSGYCANECYNAVQHGISIPKGHGRLFDERDIVNGNYEIIGNKIYEVEPIIEADNAESEG